MQSVSSRIWTRVAVSISYDDNDYTSLLNTYHDNLQIKDKCNNQEKVVAPSLTLDKGG